MSALTHGAYRQIDSSDPNCLAFLREVDGDEAAESIALVAVNFSSHPMTCVLPNLNCEGRLLLSTREPIGDRQPWRRGRLDLLPDEAVIISLHGAVDAAAHQSKRNFGPRR
jgi:hypothetical protein